MSDELKSSRDRISPTVCVQGVLIMGTCKKSKNRIAVGLVFIGVFIAGILEPRTEAQKGEEKKSSTVLHAQPKRN